MALTIPGAFASLSSGLLARKGAAKPAMRPQGFGQMGASLEDLGWNDMGFEAPRPTISSQDRDADHDAFGEAVAEQPIRNPVAALTPSPVHGQQAELAQRLAEADDDRESDRAEFAPPVQRPVPQAAAPEIVESMVVQEAPVQIQVEEAVALLPQEAVISIKPRLPTPTAEPVTLAPAKPIAVSVPVAPTIHAASGAGAKAAFTLRLDAARHLRLRLACALTGRSAQMLVIDAVDKLLTDYPELETIAGSLPDGGTSRRVRG